MTVIETGDEGKPYNGDSSSGDKWSCASRILFKMFLFVWFFIIISGIKSKFIFDHGDGKN